MLTNVLRAIVNKPFKKKKIDNTFKGNDKSVKTLNFFFHFL